MSNDSATEALAGNLRRLRVAARVSLSELARATGVGKATLSAIEYGLGNPTVVTLDALAAALGVPIVDLLGASAPDPVTVVRAGRGVPVGDGVDRMGRLVGGAELRRATYMPLTDLEEPAHPAGTRVHVVVTRGTLVVGPAERISELGPGDYAAFPADVPHVFRTGRRRAEAVVVVEPP